MAVLVSTQITGSLQVTQGITGSLLGTSSYALSASWAPSNGGVTPGGSYNISASWASSSISASYAPGSTPATYTSSLFGTASWAISASWSPAGGGVNPGGSYNISASWASSSLSASYIPTSGSINFNISNITMPITIGNKGDYIIGNNIILSSWILICNRTGSMAIEVQKSNYASYPTFISITNGNFAMVSNQHKSQSLTSGWTNTLSNGDILRFYVTSSDSSIKSANLILQGTKYV
jgi:hypothetical protein